MDRRLEQQARNEALVREVNERIEKLDKAAQDADHGGEELSFEFLCECGGGGEDITCDVRIVMTLDEYERVRSQDDRFAVQPGHQEPAIERVVFSDDRFLIVDKLSEAEPFVTDDPGARASR